MEKNIDQLHSIYLRSHTVTTDSRTVTPGCIFFALRGANFDGNQFVDKALEQGAACCVTEDRSRQADDRCMVVDDVLTTLQELARRHRDSMTVPVVAITGTNGKTTTKELVREVLRRKYRVHATAGNYNNHIGVPLTILSTPADTDILIVEMGANHPGEIDALCAIAHPDFGLITNVGKAHLEGFGSFEGVIETKTELYRYLASRNGMAFVNADNSILMQHATALSVIPDIPSMVPGYIPTMPAFDYNDGGSRLSTDTYGSAAEAGTRGSCTGAGPYMAFYFEVGDNVYRVQTHLMGGYNFDNAMAAVCVGRFFNVEPFDIKEALEQYVPENNRSQYKRTGRNELILDCYNANPSSMEAALKSFAAIEHPNKWVMLGGMRELGKDSRREHEHVIEMLPQCHPTGVLLVGEEFESLQDEARKMCGQAEVVWFADSTAACDYLRSNQLNGTLSLIKGSNSNKMWLLEEVL
ncbi:MAG: UDP-N-acetylmuramoyl-tripeptide--D-alanyl-D-alanine ligase [Bacteroidales bacterium]|nr:UDP-N-acetylmuramoyl-tripeptide--D-alanyl-D-alanine ligase [Bacteroidales bacterium]